MTDLAQRSIESGEPLWATAPRADTWLLLEYNGVWGHKALEESDLSPVVRQHLQHQSQSLPHARIQFIKQNRGANRITFFVARTHPITPMLYRFHLSSYEELLDLDLHALLSAHSERTLSEERLLLVCTNGKRDACCAKHGLPFYGALSQSLGESVWQTTHIAGHRFAGTLVSLPQGLYYGRLGVEVVPALAEAHRSHRILLDHYRGCAAYDAPVQAAEYHLRRELDLLEVAALQLREVTPAGAQQWEVRFRNLRSGQTHLLYVQAVTAPYGIYQNSTDAQPSPLTVYEVTEQSS
jgi:hypothetical protein